MKVDGGSANRRSSLVPLPLDSLAIVPRREVSRAWWCLRVSRAPVSVGVRRFGRRCLCQNCHHHHLCASGIHPPALRNSGLSVATPPSAHHNRFLLSLRRVTAILSQLVCGALFQPLPHVRLSRRRPHHLLAPTVVTTPVIFSERCQHAARTLTFSIILHHLGHGHTRPHH